MPLKINVGISKKLGLPDYGSLGASSSMEVELDNSVLGDPSAIQERIQRVYSACAQAVNDELARQRGSEQTAINGSAGSTPSIPPPAGNGNGRSGNSHTSGTKGTRASQKQMDYLRQLAGQVEGFGTRGLDSLAQKICSKPLAELTTLDASSLIDTVKAVKDGRLSLDSLNSESRT